MDAPKKTIYFGLDSMMILLTLLILWSAEAIGGFGVLLLPLVILPATVLSMEERHFALFLSFLLPAVFLLFLPFAHYAWFGFVTAAGWYVPMRDLVSRFRKVWIGNIAALLISNAGIVLGFVILHFLGVHPLAGLDPFWLVLLVIGMELELLLMDIIYQLFGVFYQNSLRSLLLR